MLTSLSRRIVIQDPRTAIDILTLEPRRINPQNFHLNRFMTLFVIQRTDRQTDKQANKQTDRKI